MTEQLEKQLESLYLDCMGLAHKAEDFAREKKFTEAMKTLSLAYNIISARIQEGNELAKSVSDICRIWDYLDIKQKEIEARWENRLR